MQLRLRPKGRCIVYYWYRKIFGACGRPNAVASCSSRGTLKLPKVQELYIYGVYMYSSTYTVAP